MKKLLIIIYIAIVALFMVNSEDVPKSNFPILSGNSYLDYEHFWDQESKKTILNVFVLESNARKKVFEVSGLKNNKVQLSSDRKKLFFLIDDLDSNNGMDDLWFIDGISGKILKLQKVSPAFSVTPDGSYLCYIDNRYIKKIPWEDGRNFTMLSIPVIIVRDLSCGNDYELDLSDTVLRDSWGIGARIKYNSTNNDFFVSFYNERDILYRYRFDIEKKEFVQE